MSGDAAVRREVFADVPVGVVGREIGRRRGSVDLDGEESADAAGTLRGVADVEAPGEGALDGGGSGAGLGEAAQFVEPVINVPGHDAADLLADAAPHEVVLVDRLDSSALLDLGEAILGVPRQRGGVGRARKTGKGSGVELAGGQVPVVIVDRLERADAGVLVQRVGVVGEVSGGERVGVPLDGVFAVADEVVGVAPVTRVGRLVVGEVLGDELAEGIVAPAGGGRARHGGATGAHGLALANGIHGISIAGKIPPASPKSAAGAVEGIF